MRKRIHTLSINVHNSSNVQHMLDLISIVYMVEFKRMNIIVGGQPDPASDHVHRSHPHRLVDADP